MKRRDFISLLGGAAATWPMVATAEQRAQMRRIGALINLEVDDPESQIRVGAFLQGLERAGWTLGRNVRIEYRWGANQPDRIRRYATELVAFAPDAILAVGGTLVAALQADTRSIPIVFVSVADPVGAGYVASLARPGGNATGFTNIEYGTSGKMLELLKQIAPGVTRAAILRDASNPSGVGQFGALQNAAANLGMEVSPINVREPADIERGIADFARLANGGLIVPSGAQASVHRKVIIEAARQNNLPSVYLYRYFAADGGLVSYGPDIIEQYRLAAGYVDRVLKGEKPSDLPVQAPTKYELVINLKTARAIGLDVPLTVLARADEVIE